MAAIHTTTIARPGVKHLFVIASSGRTQWNHRWTQTKNPSVPAAVSHQYLTVVVRFRLLSVAVMVARIEMGHHLEWRQSTPHHRKARRQTLVRHSVKRQNAMEPQMDTDEHR